MEWDDQKRKINLEKHGLDFADAELVFDEFYLRRIDNRQDYNEIRYIVLGEILGREVVLIYTVRNSVKRIISLRKANEREKKIYSKERSKACGSND